ncbi:DUF4998 domain-containing protein [Pedobacter nyackensis]|uniref:DUF4998 domain-containing protein n=1 Tax=Pedobacter nyackensis TaxID=475255 RepID=UPI00293186C8|nr:DUF4998 domain-containing protein [Pedobacter nyackensis]
MKHQSIIRYNLIAFIIVLIFPGCSKENDSIAPFIKDGEIIYATRVDSIQSFAGNNRIKLALTLPPNRTATKAIISWNDNKQVKEVPINSTDKVAEVVLENMPESSYLFKIYTADNAGNKSIALLTSGVSYGEIYQNSLSNRIVASTDLDRLNSKLTINWSGSAQGEINTMVSYTNKSGTASNITVLPTESQTVLNEVKAGSTVYVQSKYLPERKAIDAFTVLKKDEILIDLRPGNYIAVGTRANYNADGSLASSVAIAIDKQLDRTTTPGIVTTNDIANLGNFADSKMTLTFKEDNTIEVSGYISTTAPIVNHPTLPKSTYDPITGKLFLRYKYTNADGAYRLIEEVLSPKP